MSNIFVAPKIKVGFQNRSDTFTGQLAYIIYYDEKGKIRKEKSWEGWRDKTIDPKEFENIPTEGFTINKDIKRYSGEWFSSTRTMIRVHDPRGFEFEVTTENLIGILMHTDCLRRGLIGQFVYAWMGTELVLLPINSEEYKNAVKYTSGLTKKVSAKSLVPGISYKTKREGDVIYIGKMNWYSYPKESRYSTDWDGKQRIGVNVYVFTSNDGKTFINKSSVSFLAEPNTDVPVTNYAELVDKFNKKFYANKFSKFELRLVNFNPEETTDPYGRLNLVRNSYWKETSTSNLFERVTIDAEFDIKYNPNMRTSAGFRQIDSYSVVGYRISDNSYHGTNGVLNNTDKIVKILSDRHNNATTYHRLYHNVDRRCLTISEMQIIKFYDLYVIFENGEERKIDNLYDINEY